MDYPMREHKYILVDGVPVPEPDLVAWVLWFEVDENRRVALTSLGDVLISTVFLGVDFSLSGSGGDPVLFETRVFGGSLDGLMYRCATLEEAMLGHEKVVAQVKQTRKKMVLRKKKK